MSTVLLTAIAKAALAEAALVAEAAGRFHGGATCSLKARRRPVDRL